MSNINVPDGRQEILFLVGSESQIVEPLNDPSAVGLAERAIYLGQALDYLAQANIRDAFGGNEEAQKRYGINAESVAAGALKNAKEFRKAAKWAFSRAYGLAGVLESVDEDKKTEEKEKAALEFQNFQKGISTESGEQISIKELRERLAGRTRREVTIDNRNQGKRPHQQETSTNKSPEEETGLSTREKLTAILDDPRAGFIAPTNQEKNWTITYLDYLDNPEFPLGAQNQLIEVANFQRKHHGNKQGMEFAVEGGRSIAHEFSDFYIQAGAELTDLEQLMQILGDTYNPNLSLEIALNADIEKAIPLIRYMDLKTLLADGKVEYEVNGVKVRPGFSLLRSRRNEDTEIEGKNKDIVGPYTVNPRPETVKRWLKKRIAQIKVGDVRDLVGEAIVDLQRRQTFHKLVLEDFAEQKVDLPYLQEAQTVARRTLGLD